MKLSIIPYSKKDLNRAARLVADRGVDYSKGWLYVDEAAAMIKMDAWRSSYSYPLRVVASGLRLNARRIDRQALVYRRLKRMPSIVSKLQRRRDIQFTAMQDIGGCRAVLDSIEQVRELAAKYRPEPMLYPSRIKEDDYINTPKDDGYRSVHFVIPYEPTSEKYAVLHGRKVEIQIRTRLQHCWSTAVETVDLFDKQALKIGGGDPKWRRFFALVGTVFAIREKCPHVPGTPSNPDDLRDELAFLWRDLMVFQKLSGWNNAMRHIDTNPDAFAGSAIYLLEVDVPRIMMRITAWRRGEIDLANEAYVAAEKKIAGSSDHAAVLVSVDKFAALKDAFPNYHADTWQFLAELKKVIDEWKF